MDSLSLHTFVSSILFILSLGGLSHQETSRRGNLYGIAGMTIAIVATLASDQVGNFGLILVSMLVGGSIGAWVAARVEMTAMPELVAILHSFVGLAAVLVGFATYIDPDNHFVGVEKTIHDVEIYLGVLIGAVTFTGSVIAFGKLQRPDRQRRTDPARPALAQSGQYCWPASGWGACSSMPKPPHPACGPCW